MQAFFAHLAVLLIFFQWHCDSDAPQLASGAGKKRTLAPVAPVPEVITPQPAAPAPSSTLELALTIAAQNANTNDSMLHATLSVNHAADFLYLTTKEGCQEGGQWHAYATQANFGPVLPGKVTLYAMAKDKAGNTSSCVSASTTYVGLVPGHDGAIEIDARFSSSITVSWTKAQYMDATPLSYNLYYSRESDLTTLSARELEALATSVGNSGVQASGWQAALTATISALRSATDYSLQLAVRDTNGFVALYRAKTVSTQVDSIGPVLSDANVRLTDITAHSVKVSWTSATDQNAIQYFVYYSSDHTLDSVNTITTGRLWSGTSTTEAEIHSVDITGLDDGKKYHFNVLSVDINNNPTIYTSKMGTTLDVTAPKITNRILRWSNLSSSSVTLAWDAAEDNATPQEDLEYQVMQAAQASEIDDLAKITTPAILMDWAKTLTYTAIELSDGTRYAFNVLVRDTATPERKINIYTPVSITTTDSSAPIPSDEAVVFSNVSGSSITITWPQATDKDDVTAQSNLEYKVVRVPQLGRSYSIDELNSLPAVMDWAKQTSATASGLDDSQTYGFIVLVRDATHNMNQYPLQSQSTLDTTAPTPSSTPLAFSDISHSGMTVTWLAATDKNNATAQNLLQYKLVQAALPTDIDTKEKANATNATVTVVMDWTANTLISPVVGLTDSTSYAFAVLVRDAATPIRNINIYAPATQITLDATAPTPSSTPLAFSNISGSGMNVTWLAATDKNNATAQNLLQYKLVRAALPTDIDTKEKANATNATVTVVMDWTTNTLTSPVVGLPDSTSYAFAVLVRDAATPIRNINIYTPATEITLDTTAPTPSSTPLAFSNISNSEMTVTWLAATDNNNVTAQNILQYKLVRAALATDIDTKDEANAINGTVTVVMDWATNILTSPVVGLTDSNSYAFVVLVRDAATPTRNINIATPATQSTLDTTAPTPSSTPLAFSNISGSGMTVTWLAATDKNNATAQNLLQYKLVRAALPTDIDTKDEANAVNGTVTVVMDWTTNTLSKVVTALTDYSPYAFAVLVRDAATPVRNMSNYPPVSQSTSDGSAPILPSNSSLTFTNITTTSVTVSWLIAADKNNVTPQNALQYKLVRAPLVSSINTLGGARAGTTAMDWTTNTLSYTVTGLTDSTNYAFNVLVRDAVGNDNFYTASSTMTQDASPPVVSPSTLTVSNLSDTTLTINLTQASDLVSAQSTLQYRAYYSTVAANVASKASMESSATPAGAYATYNVGTGIPITSLARKTIYYFNVIVKDQAGFYNIYAPVPVTTGGQVFIFDYGADISSNLKGDAMNARVGADNLCIAKKSSSYGSLACGNIRAFISINPTDEIRDMPTNYGMPTTSAFYNTGGNNKIAINWADLLDGTIAMNLFTAGILANNAWWWAGSDQYGAVNGNSDGVAYPPGYVPSPQTCGQWTNTVANGNARIGFATPTYPFQWLNGAATSCDYTLRLLCVCW